MDAGPVRRVSSARAPDREQNGARLHARRTWIAFDPLGPLGYAPAALSPDGGGDGRAPVAPSVTPASETRARGGEPGLAEVRVGENETFESALRRFNKKIQQSGILAEARRREHYEKPSVKRKRKEAKRKKNARTQQG